MKVSWFKGLTKLEKADVESAFKESAYLRKRLKEVLENKSDELRRKVRSEVAYDNPNWAYLQADAVGYERAISDIISLIEE